jgi:biotin carboxyl carrier protein
MEESATGAPPVKINELRVAADSRIFEFSLDSTGKRSNRGGADSVITFVNNRVGEVLRCRLTKRFYCRQIDITHYEVWLDHYVIQVVIEDFQSAMLNELHKRNVSANREHTVKAPMPGLVLKIEVQEGDEIQEGAGLVILEAMKMENEIRSPIAGRVKSILVAPRSPVEKEQRMIIIEPVK